MFIERLLDQGNAPLLEQTVRFAAARHRLIAENIVNVDTPNYRQKDLSVDKFQAMLRDRVDARRAAAPGEDRPGFGGMLVHSYDGLKALINQPTTQPAAAE